MSDVAQLRAEVEQLDRELVEAKGGDTDPEAYQDLKRRVRQARYAYRTARSGGVPGDGAADAATVSVAAATDERGLEQWPSLPQESSG
jgi:hypothetical protein